ncbi:outer membrane protein assembly factor, partial [Leptolyngbya sp. FACHB-36]|uniref:POTRA domain-containing protein n=1 Tax=Leptolyngbya sp. FACHB-36 TaxID=2692808 RepID=UPI0019A26AB9
MNASSIRTPIRHASALAVCTLAAIAAWEPQPVQAADRSLAPTVTSDVVVPVAPVPAAVAQAATPETSAAPEFSAAAPETTGKPAQYYQYQVPTAPVAPAPSAPAAPEPPSSSPWVIPSAAAPAPTAKPTVTVPPQSQSAPQRQAPAPAPLATPTSPGDLAVQATDVQIVGADAELQQLIRSRIRTQPGGQTNQAQLKQDVAEILETGLFANASVTSRPNPQGLSVVFQVEPIVVRSLQLSGAQVLTLDVANQLLQPQLGQVVRPSVLAQGAQRIKAWYTQNGYVLAQVSLQPTREGVVIVQVAEGLVGDIQIRFLNREGRPVDEQGKPIQPRTQVGFVRQQIQLQPGQVFREDVARQDLNRLIGLGIFENANVTFEGDVRRATVVYNLVESSARGFNFGGGYNDDLGIYGTIS